MAKYKNCNQYNNNKNNKKKTRAGTILQEDTLMIQHHIDVSQLHCSDCGGALVQTGHRNVLVFIRTNHTVLKVQFILITRHRELWRTQQLWADSFANF